ncbi:hypothetical protein [Microbispora sp. CA-102843]
MTSSSPEPEIDPIPDRVLGEVLATLEPHREQLEPLPRAAAEAEDAA